MKNYRVSVNKKGLRELIKNEPKRADAWLRSVGFQMLGDIQLSFGTSPDGRAYKRKNVTHIASQPGYPPNIDKGALRASMGLRRLRIMQYEIHDGKEYGYWLEMGTEKIAPRPFVAPVFADWQKKILADAKKNLGLT